MSVNDDLFDAAVRHQIGLVRLAAGIVAQIHALLDSSGRDLLKKIRARGDGDSKLTTRRLEALLREMERVNREAYGTMLERTTASLNDLATYEEEYQRDVLRRLLPVRLDFVQPSRDLLQAVVTEEPLAGQYLSEWFDGMAEGRMRRLRTALRTGLAEGETIDQMVRRVRGTRARQYRDGVLDGSRRSAEAIVRTAVNHVATASREILYAANKRLLKGVRWVSTLDTRTTQICIDRDGEVFPPDSGPRPPAHVNCRSTTTPVTKSWRELGLDADDLPEATRASMSGQEPAGTTYREWLVRQSAAVQDEVLGPTRGAMLRRGEVTVDAFSDDRGRRYTLAELREREGLGGQAR